MATERERDGEDLVLERARCECGCGAPEPFCADEEEWEGDEMPEHCNECGDELRPADVAACRSRCAACRSSDDVLYFGPG